MARATQMGGGIQYHHQHNLGGAAKDAINMVQWLRGVIDITGTAEHKQLLDDALALCRRIGQAHREAHANLAEVYETDPERFARCREGLEPWPGELAEGFEPICMCERRCLFHDTQANGSSVDDCNCWRVCPRHNIPRRVGDREPLLPLPSPEEET